MENVPQWTLLEQHFLGSQSCLQTAKQMSEIPISVGNMNRSLSTSAITISGSSRNNRQSIRLRLRCFCSSEKQALCFWRSYYLIGGTPLELLFSVGGGGDPLLGRCTSLQKLVAEFLCKSRIRKKKKKKPDKIEHAIFHMVCNGERSSALSSRWDIWGSLSQHLEKQKNLHL